MLRLDFLAFDLFIVWLLYK